MAKVELVVDGGNEAVVLHLGSEYADGCFEESKLAMLIEDLTINRNNLQRKLDAARKRLKRLGVKLNKIEEDWVMNPA